MAVSNETAINQITFYFISLCHPKQNLLEIHNILQLSREVCRYEIPVNQSPK